MIEPPEPPPGWLEGPIGLLRAAGLLLVGSLIGAVAAIIQNTGVTP